MYVYIYIYIERERERQRDTYIYKYTRLYIHISCTVEHRTTESGLRAGEAAAVIAPMGAPREIL